MGFVWQKEALKGMRQKQGFWNCQGQSSLDELQKRKMRTILWQTEEEGIEETANCILEAVHSDAASLISVHREAVLFPGQPNFKR